MSSDRELRPPRAPLDPIEVAAATLTCLPDMTPKRLAALLARGGGPIGALAALERGLGAAVLCDGASAADLPGRIALARIWLAEITRVPLLAGELRIALFQKRTHALFRILRFKAAQLRFHLVLQHTVQRLALSHVDGLLRRSYRIRRRVS